MFIYSSCTRKIHLNHQEELYKKLQLRWAACHSDYNRQEVSFASFPTDKCHAGGNLVHSVLPCSYEAPVVIFVVGIRNMLMVSKIKAKQHRKPITHHTVGRCTHTSSSVGNFPLQSVSQSYTQCVFTYSHWWSGRESASAVSTKPE